MATEMINTSINGQWNIMLPKHRSERPEWQLCNGGWEKERLLSIYNHVKEGDIFYYVGNEEGDMSGLISTWGAKMVLVEPNLLVWPNTKAIWDANNIELPLTCFVGFATHKTDFKIDDLVHNNFPECANGEVISNHGFKQLQDGEDISKITIDYLVELTGHIPKHISCDIEGHECFAFEGAIETLKKHKPNLWISIHPEFLMLYHNKYSYDFRRWIKNLGYKERLLAFEHEAHFFYESV